MEVGGFDTTIAARDEGAGVIVVRVGYQPPYQFDRLLAFFRMRALAGVEVMGERFYLRTARIALPGGGEARGWVRVENDAARNALAVTLSESLAPALPQVIARIRCQFDIDCDPQAIFGRLASLDNAVPGAAVPGTRVPGCLSTRASIGVASTRRRRAPRCRRT